MEKQTLHATVWFTVRAVPVLLLYLTELPHHLSAHLSAYLLLQLPACVHLTLQVTL
ncbi:hypothetical protein DPMN_129197 [Dreissena polymorpha]|uniref:Uncharacterized protein n=1 Tax=Dreissena polymorpha TaxID=45954 RepID=A0A9D4H0S5_DREPO|nr:hypothetical protein DPMN_129197 [Dreissena polymorpha]